MGSDVITFCNVNQYVMVNYFTKFGCYMFCRSKEKATKCLSCDLQEVLSLPIIKLGYCMSFYHHAKFGFLVINSIFAYCGPEIKRENRN